ncbi:MAG: hypothetical protein KAT68_08595 [Bacteroidales bacterium]|nr:hypothetical protein [Bacteroidales bacterium]
MISPPYISELIDGIELSNEMQFHLLSHFIETDKNYINLFTKETNYTKTEIIGQLKKPGSKFFKSFANNPIHLVQKIEETLSTSKIIVSEHAQRLKIEIIVNQLKFPDGIGWNTIIHKDDLLNIDNIKVVEIQRGGFILKSVNIEKPITCQFNIVFENKELKTIFPGIYAPPFLNKEMQTSTFYKMCADFWQKHLIIN